MSGPATNLGLGEELEKLRERIYETEKALSRYGFDPRRGIESYKVSELKALISRSQNAEEVKQLLLRVIELQEQLYMELYRIAGLKQMNIDTDTPEKRLTTIKRWLITGRTGSARLPKPKFKEALRMVADALEACTDNCEEEVRNVLRKAYKRDYDRYRVVKRALELCASYRNAGKEILENVDSEPIGILVGKLVNCAERVGKEKLARIIKVAGGGK